MSYANDFISERIRLLEIEEEKYRIVLNDLMCKSDELYRFRRNLDTNTFSTYEQILSPKYYNAHKHSFQIFNIKSEFYQPQTIYILIENDFIYQYCEIYMSHTDTLEGYMTHNNDGILVKVEKFTTTIPVSNGDVIKLQNKLLKISDYPNCIWPEKWGKPYFKELRNNESQPNYSM